MKYALMTTFSLLILQSPNLIAGDGGFDLYSCTSNSGRTVLSMKADYLSESRKPILVNFGIDGEFVRYDYKIKYVNGSERPDCVKPDSCVEAKWSYQDQSLLVQQGGDKVLSVTFKDNNYAVIEAGMVDPREGRVTFDQNIYLECKNYFEGP